MSHIVTIKTEVRDPEAVKAACCRLGLPEPVQGTARLFEGEAEGLLVKLPGWVYPAVVDVNSGLVRYDNYQGSWGDPKHLDAFLQAYAVCKATIEARKRGHSVFEQALPDGSVKLTIQVGGGDLNKTIEITVGPRGETTVQTKGFSGPECRDASKFLEQALGKKTAEQMTGEFYSLAGPELPTIAQGDRGGTPF